MEPVTWEIPKELALWELIGTLILAQNQLGIPVALHADNPEHAKLIQAAGVALTAAPANRVLPYLRPDAVDAMGRIESYPELLARVAEVPLLQVRPKLTLEDVAAGVEPCVYGSTTLKFAWPQLGTQERGIVVCPYTFQRDLELPLKTWQEVVRVLRSFREPVYMLGEKGQRLDAAQFPENMILSELHILEKLNILASAKLVVGVPNAWTWMANAWQRRMVYFYPHVIPPRRWFWESSPEFGRCLFDPQAVETPVLLAGLRMLINGF